MLVGWLVSFHSSPLYKEEWLFHRCWILSSEYICRTNIGRHHFEMRVCVCLSVLTLLYPTALAHIQNESRSHCIAARMNEEWKEGKEANIYITLCHHMYILASTRDWIESEPNQPNQTKPNHTHTHTKLDHSLMFVISISTSLPPVDCSTVMRKKVGQFY